MLRKQKYECIVCGRVFPQGQGIVIVRAGITLAFHSKTCLSKFFKLFVERVDEKEFKKTAREIVKELEEAKKQRMKPKEI